MLPLIFSREIGLTSSSSFNEFVRKSRTKNLELSQNIDFEPIHPSTINSCDLDFNEERYLLSGSGKGTIAIHDLHLLSSSHQHTFKTVSNIGLTHKQRHSHAVSRVQWYPQDTGVFTSSGMDKFIKIWDTNESCVVSEFSFLDQVQCHKMSKSLLLIAIACENDKIQLLDLKSNSSTHKLTGHYKKAVMDVCWSPQNDYHLISAGKDGKVILWDIRKAKSCCFMFDRHNAQTSANPASVNTAHDGAVNGLSVLPDGNHFLSFGTDNCVRLWNVKTGRNVLCNYGKVGNSSKMNLTIACTESFAFIPSDKNIFILDIFGGCQVKTLRGHLDHVNCCVYKSESQELISSSKDRSILHWSNKGGYSYKDLIEAEGPKPHNIPTNPLLMDSWSDEEA